MDEGSNLRQTSLTRLGRILSWEMLIMDRKLEVARKCNSEMEKLHSFHISLEFIMHCTLVLIL